MSEENNNVVDIFINTPHQAGNMRCLACKHDWTGVVPVGTHTVECPQCGCFRGTWKQHFSPAVGDEYFECTICGGSVFYVLRRSVMCIGCTVYTKFEDL